MVQEILLNQQRFNKLVFMGADSRWLDEEENHQFLISLCFQPLEIVTTKVIQESGVSAQYLNSAEVFANIQHVRATCDPYPWFEKHLNLNNKFDKEKMGKIWVRNLTYHERDCCPTGSFYIEDGNHRALVCAVRVACGEEAYQDVKAQHATSWDFKSKELGHSCQPASALENGGMLQSQQEL